MLAAFGVIKLGRTDCVEGVKIQENLLRLYLFGAC